MISWGESDKKDDIKEEKVAADDILYVILQIGLSLGTWFYVHGGVIL